MFNKHGCVRACSVPLTQSVVLNCGGTLSREGRATVLFVKRLAMVGGL
jgi:hypothetical protein